MTQKCAGNLTLIGSDNGLSPDQVTSHYLNQCRNIVNWTFMNKLQWNFNRNSHISIQENSFESVLWKMAAILSLPQCVTVWEDKSAMDKETKGFLASLEWSLLTNRNTVVCHMIWSIWKYVHWWVKIVLLLAWHLEPPAWINNYIHYKVWDGITYPFLNFNGCTIEV